MYICLVWPLQFSEQTVEDPAIFWNLWKHGTKQSIARFLIGNCNGNATQKAINSHTTKDYRYRIANRNARFTQKNKVGKYEWNAPSSYHCIHPTYKQNLGTAQIKQTQKRIYLYFSELSLTDVHDCNIIVIEAESNYNKFK